jgi:hypothetical protein
MIDNNFIGTQAFLLESPFNHQANVHNVPSTSLNDIGLTISNSLRFYLTSLVN